MAIGRPFEENKIPYTLPSCVFKNHIEDDLNQAIKDSIKQILLQIENFETTRSDLELKKIDLAKIVKLKGMCQYHKLRQNMFGICCSIYSP